MRFLLSFMFLLIPLTGCLTLDNFVLQPCREIISTPDHYGLTYEDFFLSVDKQRFVHAWLIKREEERSDTVLVFLPGSNLNKSYYVGIISNIFRDVDFDVLIIDYEGYGLSYEPNLQKTPSFVNMVDDVFATVNYAKEHYKNVIGFGFSIGTPLLARVAAEINLAGCIFEGTVILRDEVRLWLDQRNLDFAPLVILSYILITPQVPADYDIEHYIQMVDEPKLFIHSYEDTTTPLEGGLRIYNMTNRPKDIWVISGLHGYFAWEHPEEYRERLLNWMDSILGELK